MIGGKVEAKMFNRPAHFKKRLLFFFLSFVLGSSCFLCFGLPWNKIFSPQSLDDVIENSPVEQVNGSNETKPLTRITAIKLVYKGDPQNFFKTEMIEILKNAGFTIVAETSQKYDAIVKIEFVERQVKTNYQIKEYQAWKEESWFWANSIDCNFVIEHAQFGKLFSRYISGEDQIKTSGGLFGSVVETAATNFKKQPEYQILDRLILAVLNKSTAPLLPMLKHEDKKVRIYVIDTLGDFQDINAIEPLIACLKDADVDVRAKTATVLGNFKNFRAAIALINALNDTQEVSTRAKQALEDIGEEAVDYLVMDLKLGFSKVLPIIIEILGNIKDTRAVEPLISVIKEGKHRFIRLRAVEALGKIGDSRALEVLPIALSDEEEKIRIAAVEALENIKDNRVVELLIVALKDKTYLPRSLAARILGEIKDSRAVEPLILSLGDEAQGPRADAAFALGEIGDARAVEPLIAVLKDSSDLIRYNAVEALGKIKDSRAIEPLGAAMVDRFGAVDERVIWALSQFQDSRATQMLVSALKYSPYNDNLITLISKRGKDAVEPLIAALKESDWNFRYAAAGILGMLEDSRAVEPLIATMKDKESSVRVQAIESLGEIGDIRAVEPIIAALKNKEVKAAAIRALGRLGDRRAVKPIIPNLRNQWGHIREYAAEALGELKDSRAIEPLLKALNDDSPVVREKTARALGKIKDSRAVGPLITALKDTEQPVKLAAVEALGEIKDSRAIEPLIELLKMKELEIKYTVEKSLTKITGKDFGTDYEKWKNWLNEVVKKQASYQP